MIYQTEMPDKIDSTSTSGATYLGYAKAGTIGTDEANWAIIKVTDTEILYADGNLSYDKVWDDRTSLDYLIRKF